MKEMTIKIHMLNTGLETIYKAVEKNRGNMF